MEFSSLSVAGGAGTLGAVLGGVLIKLIGYKSRKEMLLHKETEAIRLELRQDIAALQIALASINSDLDKWKEKYYELREENLELVTKCQALEDEIAELRRSLKAHTDSTPQSLSPANLSKMQ